VLLFAYWYLGDRWLRSWAGNCRYHYNWRLSWYYYLRDRCLYLRWIEISYCLSWWLELNGWCYWNGFRTVIREYCLGWLLLFNRRCRCKLLWRLNWRIHLCWLLIFNRLGLIQLWCSAHLINWTLQLLALNLWRWSILKLLWWRITGLWVFKGRSKTLLHWLLRRWQVWMCNRWRSSLRIRLYWRGLTNLRGMTSINGWSNWRFIW
jgi:hypothetical protein